jgi:glyoxylase-like metal-dependent hydrolase (beta-lactamase superfamily II)
MEANNTTPGLAYETFISDPVEVATSDLVPNGDKRMFSPMTATLISGKHDAVLVDPPMTIAQAAAVGDWIESSGKNLTAIYITHGHGDHWFGSGPLVKRFPQAQVFATPGTIAMMRVHGSAEFRAALWDAQFPGQIPESPVIATTPPGNRITLEGHELLAIEVGHTDTDDTTVLHVPSLALVVAGDVIYNNVHQYLRESQGTGLASWRAAIDVVESLHPQHVVAGHKDRTRDDSVENIALTRRYLDDAEALLTAQPRPTALSFFADMLGIYPDRLNPGALWSGAVSLLPEVR